MVWWWRSILWGLVWVGCWLCGEASAQQTGSIRGIVFDKEFESPLAGVEIMVVAVAGADPGVEGHQKARTTDQGNYVLSGLRPGKYTLVCSKEGFLRQVKADVVVTAGTLTDLDVWLSGEFTEMDDFVVQDLLRSAGGSETALLRLRFESPSFLDSIGSDLLSRAGASDAAAALPLVSGATVQDGRFAVIRGLPDRYVVSQLNGVRLPTADEDKRAVELDQFPAAIIESIQISKTFTPDQQGDASGGAVDIRLKGIPEEPIFQFKAEYGYNTNVRRRDDFLGYSGGGVNSLGRKHTGRKLQYQNLGESWTGAAGVEEVDAPIDWKWSGAAGGKHEFDNGLTFGGFFSLFYEQDSSYYDDAQENSFVVDTPGGPLVPEVIQGSAGDDNQVTSLFDVTQGTDTVQWGGLGTLGLESENHALTLTYLYTQTTEDKATLAEDTRGKLYYFPDYDVNDPNAPGNERGSREAAPYVRTETLEYTERTVETIQLHGKHKLPGAEFLWPLPEDGIDGFIKPLPPEVDFTVSYSSADLDQPDKRQFGSVWLADSSRGAGRPIDPAEHRAFKPAANFTLGNFQRIFKTIDEDSTQFAVNLKLPFEQWSGDEGYFKLGFFDDSLDREFRQETFSNFAEGFINYEGDFEDRWSGHWPPPEEDHPITESLFDVDYDGSQDIRATYIMLDLPLTSFLNLIGGVRLESTDLKIKNEAEEFAVWFPPGSNGPRNLEPGDADVDLSQDDLLPSVGFLLEPLDKFTLRGSYSETIARPTFKELTPISQQEFLGGPVFVGNPDLDLAALKNYDLRLDYEPYEGGLYSISYFYKDIENAIENVQRFATFTFTTPVNFPEGEIRGWEFEARQSLGRLWEPAEGLSAGANLTLIDSKVRLPQDQRDLFEISAIQAPQSSRDATNAPDRLYNLYLTYDAPATGTQASLFYTVRGDTLIAGAGITDSDFVPDLYEEEFGTLNFTFSQRIWKFLRFEFKAKNLTDPTIRTVYRSAYTAGDVTRSSYTRGIDYSVSLSMKLAF